MTLRIEWEKSAQLDREAIFLYLFNKAGLPVASATDDKFIHSVALLAENPFVGTQVHTHEKQRKLVVAHFPFIILYQVEATVLSVLRILHTSRKIAGL